MDKIEATDKLKKYKSILLKHFDIDKLYLFGSFAKGTNTPNSDIDVAVVVNKLSGDYFTTTPLLWKLRRNVDLRIEPILFEKDNDADGFLEEIERTGIEII